MRRRVWFQSERGTTTLKRKRKDDFVFFFLFFYYMTKIQIQNKFLGGDFKKKKIKKSAQ